MDVGWVVLFLGKVHEDNNSIEGSNRGLTSFSFAAKILRDISHICKIYASSFNEDLRSQVYFLESFKLSGSSPS
jgi:hypothetical protein